MISVVIGTYGSDEWRDLAYSRAVPSVLASAPDTEIIPVHGQTLAQARNEGARQASTDWLCFLDADDELAPRYLAAMRNAIYSAPVGEPILFTPRIEYVHGRKRYRPRFQPQVPIEDGNWLVIGTVVPTRLFREIGGFEEFPFYEDWALFARMQKAGATVERVADAVYVAHRRAGSRNHPAGGRREKLRVHDLIRRAVFPELYEEVA